MPLLARARAFALAALLLPAVGCGAVVGADPTANPPVTGPPGADAARGIPMGAGPQTHYSVQDQPAAGACHFRYDHEQPLPDPMCTPGAISPAVTQANLKSTICRKGGYTGGVRPSSYVTGKEKTANAKSYGYTGSMRDAEYDHLISLQLGGDPNDPRNLWVEPPSPGHRSGAGPNNPKDAVETHLHTAICDGTVTLAAAQQAIATDWVTAENRLGIRR